MNWSVFPCGDSAVTIQIGNAISEAVNREVVAVVRALQARQLPGILEIVPSYCAVTVHYDPLLLSYEQLTDALHRLDVMTDDMQPYVQRIVQIPVCYGGVFGPDLGFVAQHNGLTEEEVIQRHSNGLYLVYMLGFLPGFAYMGGMDESITCPRLTTPRTKIPAGSVGIAGAQTGVYPLDSPGGWQLIGRTPLKMFAINDDQAGFTLAAGDHVRCVPISEERYRELEGTV